MKCSLESILRYSFEVVFSAKLTKREGGERGFQKPQNRTEIRQKTANRIGFSPEHRNRTYREAHYMKADVTNTWGLFCCFCKHRCFCWNNRNYQYKSKIKSLEWKRYIDDVFSSWDAKREEIDQFILEANRHHPTINFPAEISNKETNFLDTTIFKGERFHKDSIFDICTHFKPTEKFQYTHYTSCHAPGVKKGFCKRRSAQAS